MSLSKVDKAVSAVKFILKKKRKRIDEMGRRTEVTENQKIFIGEELELIQNVEILLHQCQQNINVQLGKLPPQDLELEEVVLGALILETPSQKAIKILEEKHFYLQANREIFKCIKRLWMAGSPVDLKTVVNDLRKYSLLESVGGVIYIANLTAKVSSAANIEYHSRILIEMGIKRELILTGGKMVQDAYEPSADALTILDEAAESVKEINSWVK